jgi:hypothetical protein
MSWIRRLFTRLTSSRPKPAGTPAETCVPSRPKPAGTPTKTYESVSGQCNFTVNSDGFVVTYLGPNPKPSLRMAWSAVSSMDFPERKHRFRMQTFWVESTEGRRKFVIDYNHLRRSDWEDLKGRISMLTTGRIYIELPEFHN